jgi:phospholipid-binding lipoprotein MlaA
MMSRRIRPRARSLQGLSALLLVLTLAGCGTLGSPMSDAASHVPPPRQKSADPWERFNRAIFSFNDRIDRAVLIPLARAYKAVVPEVIASGFDNMLNNVTDVWSAANHLLQGKPQQALDSGMRVGVNSVFGLAGILDVASGLGSRSLPGAALAGPQQRA